MSRWTKESSARGLVLKCGKTEMLWNRSGDLMSFAGLRSGGKGFDFGAGSALWRIELRDRRGYCVQLDSSAWKNFSCKIGRVLSLEWKGLADDAVDVLVNVNVEDDTTLVRCRMEITNRGGKYTVWAIHFPSLTDIKGPTGSHRNDVLITTDGFGSAIPDPIRQPKLTAWTNKGYPNGLQTLPLVALTNGGKGLYFGVHNPDAGVCRFQHQPNRDDDRLPMAILIEPEDAGRVQKKIKLNYDIVLGLFEGDWFDVAGIYRAWALKQKWIMGKVEDRPDIPEWSRHMSMWVRLNVPEICKDPKAEMRRMSDTVLKFREVFGRDFAAHLYTWHDHPFDILYPDYTPRPGAKEFIKNLQAGGIKVMPYINGRLFDLDTPDWIKDGARRFATKEAAPKVDGCAEKLFTEVYGSNTQMAVMCPATKYWQDKVAGIVARLVKDLGVDAVYIDQLPAAWSEVCSDRTHGHPLRGGGWWIEGYTRMMDEVQRRLHQPGMKQGILLTSECNADPYLGMFGNFLMLHSVRNFVVPMFTAIYGGYAPMFAREANPEDRQVFRIMTAQNILWGCQNGWFGIKELNLLMQPEYKDELDFLKGLCDLYERMLPFFDGGEMLRPPVPVGNVKQVQVMWKFCINWPEVVPVVWTARWKRGDSRIVAVVNTWDRKQSVSIPLTAEEIASASPGLWWAGNGEGKATMLKGQARLDLPPRGMALMQFDSGSECGTGCKCSCC